MDLKFQLKKYSKILWYGIVFYCTSVLFGCQTESVKNLPQTSNKTLFTILTPEQSGVQFVNSISESKEKNYFNYEYIYNGAGVALGDINQDDLVDIFFVGNEQPNKLYLNKGNLEFEDISQSAGVEGNGGWCTGANFVDINNDGLLDIYVCKSGAPGASKSQRTNLLYINQGEGKFNEQATVFGINESGFSIQSSFFDADNDGDLDLYVTNHPYAFNLDLEERLKIRNDPPESVRDKFYRNDGNGRFEESAKEAGIVNYGHGLGIVTSDVNQDGFIDIYIANDYKEPDYLYINQGDGTFNDQIKKYTGHIAFNSMGVDVADINNDGLEDILTTEMLPSDYKRSKTNMASMNITLFENMKQLGLHNQYMHNMLQLNTGSGRFSECSQLAGVSKTDWSWSCLMSDYDNDGYRDIFIANGNKRDVFDKDYVEKANQKANQKGGSISLDELYKLIPSTKVANEIFRNTGDLKFEKMTYEWGLSEPMLSQGAAEADLDNDGDLDLVVNNLDESSYILKNNAESIGNNFIQVKLKGNKDNLNGLNAKVKVYHNQNDFQFFEMKTVRGYESCSQAIAHFGLGEIDQVEKIEVQWLDGRQNILKSPSVNQRHLVDHKNAKLLEKRESSNAHLFKTDKARLNPQFVHQENKHDDYKNQILLPHKLSQNGPFVSTGDINGDNLDDFFVGGASGQSGASYMQNLDGTFTKKEQAVFQQDKQYEDLGSVIFDADGDSDLDLFVVSGGSEFMAKSPYYQDRLYLNDGNGKFSKSDANALPQMLSSCQSVTPGDFDSDGDMDLFVGGRVFPEHYPYGTPSYLLENQGGRFIDIALTQQQGLNMVGMVTSSCWNDIDNDQDLDLIIVGEWMPITIFENDQGVFKNATEKYNLGNTTGWWNKIVPADYDNDGDMDFVVGNLGLNHKFSATKDEPFHVYCGDYDANGSFDVVLAKHYGDTQVPIRGKQCSSEQMPFISENFPTYEAFANADITDIIGEQINEKLHYQANMFESIILENDNGRFSIKKLPTAAQLSPINGIVTKDINNDGYLDIILGGNMYQTEAETSQADGSVGMILLGQKDHSFKTLTSKESGFFIPGDVKDLTSISLKEGAAIIVTNNNSNLEIFTLLIER